MVSPSASPVVSPSASPVVYQLEEIDAATYPSGTIITHNAGVPVLDQRWSAIIQTDADGYISQLDNSWLTDIIDSNSIRVDFDALAPADLVNIKLEHTGLSVDVASTRTYDSGFIGADVLDAQLPITHNLTSVPVNQVLLRETATTGEYEALDPASYIASTNNVVSGDLSALGTDKVRLVLSATPAGLPVLSGFNTKVTDASINTFTRDEIMVDTSTSALTITLPINPELGDRVRVSDVAENSSNFNITIARNGSLIESAASDFTINTDGATIEAVYTNSTFGWKILSMS